MRCGISIGRWKSTTIIRRVGIHDTYLPRAWAHVQWPIRVLGRFKTAVDAGFSAGGGKYRSLLISTSPVERFLRRVGGHGAGGRRAISRIQRRKREEREGGGGRGGRKKTGEEGKKKNQRNPMESNRLQRPVSHRRYDNHAGSTVTVLFSLAFHSLARRVESRSHPRADDSITLGNNAESVDSSLFPSLSLSLSR